MASGPAIANRAAREGVGKPLLAAGFAKVAQREWKREGPAHEDRVEFYMFGGASFDVRDLRFECDVAMPIPRGLDPSPGSESRLRPGWWTAQVIDEPRGPTPGGYWQTYDGCDMDALVEELTAATNDVVLSWLASFDTLDGAIQGFLSAHYYLVPACDLARFLGCPEAVQAPIQEAWDNYDPQADPAKHEQRQQGLIRLAERSGVDLERTPTPLVDRGTLEAQLRDAIGDRLLYVDRRPYGKSRQSVVGLLKPTDADLAQVELIMSSLPPGLAEVAVHWHDEKDCFRFRREAERILEEAKVRNPGIWGSVGMTAGSTTSGFIWVNVSAGGLDPEAEEAIRAVVPSDALMFSPPSSTLVVAQRWAEHRKQHPIDP